MAEAGYSGTPLAQKLSLKPGLRTWFDHVPAGVRAAIGDVGLIELAEPVPPVAAAVVFVTDRASLERRISALRIALAPAGFAWISWPKKTSKVPTDVTEDVIRAVALPTELVDVTVCAVDTTWSGLKLMIRKELR